MMLHLLLAMQMGAAPVPCGSERTLVKASAAPAAATSAEYYSGRQCELEVRVPRLAGEVHVDGLLDEPVWQRAAVLHGFSEYKPVDGREAEDSTQVLVWYSDNAINFGVRAFESHVALN